MCVCVCVVVVEEAIAVKFYIHSYQKLSLILICMCTVWKESDGVLGFLLFTKSNWNAEICFRSDDKTRIENLKFSILEYGYHSDFGGILEYDYPLHTYTH